jgi:hypothetical protein
MMPISATVNAAPALAYVSPFDGPELNVPAELVDAMSEDEIVGLLLLRMRALLARGYEPSDALIAAARLGHTLL